MPTIKSGMPALTYSFWRASVSGRNIYSLPRPQEENLERQKFYQVKKVCEFCKKTTKDIDYKNVKVLQKFISFYGKIEFRKRSGCCAKHQRILAKEIKKARHVALLPFTAK